MDSEVEDPGIERRGFRYEWCCAFVVCVFVCVCVCVCICVCVYDSVCVSPLYKYFRSCPRECAEIRSCWGHIAQESRLCLCLQKEAKNGQLLGESLFSDSALDL